MPISKVFFTETSNRPTLLTHLDDDDARQRIFLADFGIAQKRFSGTVRSTDHPVGIVGPAPRYVFASR